jgi:hypothetical protein
MYKIRILAAVGAASALAAALAFTLPAATAASRSGSPPPVGTEKLTGSIRLAPGIHYRTALINKRTVKAATVTSSNWSGYEISANAGQTIKKVQALFNVPSINCANSTLGTGGDALWSDWVGLDGFSNMTVEQTGVAAECTSTTGPPTYFGFNEMFPNPATTFTGISPGDAIVVVVQKVSGHWQLVLQDRTTGGTVSTTQACPAGSTCSDANGEVITEDFNNSVPVDNLADFGLDTQTDMFATSGGGRTGSFGSGSLWTSNTIDLANPANNHRMATPGPLEGGEAFYLSWNASS